MPEKQLQDYLFQYIREALPPGRSLVDVVAEVLHISQDSAYRRIRGETLLVLEEARTLCQEYHISLDQLLDRSVNSVVFQSMEHAASVTDFTTYLFGILHELKALNNFQHKSIIYITNDIPFFYQFCYKPLFAFRYFFWMKTIVQHPGFKHLKFTLDCLPPETEEAGRQVLALYNSISSTEIWNTESINGTLMQVNYYVEAGIMTKNEAMEVYNALQKTLEHVQHQADHGRKFLPGEVPQSRKDNFQLFQNRTGLGDNTILTTGDGGKKLYLNYDALSYMATTDEVFCNKVQQQIQIIMRRSTLISTASEKQRNIFFNNLYRKIPQLEVTTPKLAS
jgi:hypothetical protein